MYGALNAVVPQSFFLSENRDRKMDDKSKLFQFVNMLQESASPVEPSQS